MRYQASFNGKFKLLAKFGSVGVLNTLIDFGVFTVLQKFLGINYVLSQVLGYTSGVINSFILNGRWTFKDRKSNKKVYYEFLQFLAVNVVSLIVTSAAIKFLVSNLNVNVYISKIIVTIIAQGINFLAYKLVVFK